MKCIQFGNKKTVKRPKLADQRRRLKTKAIVTKSLTHKIQFSTAKACKKAVRTLPSVPNDKI
jgi:hypothetical protein